MKRVFAQLALVFPQFWVFEAIFDPCGQNFHRLLYSVYPLLLYSKRPSQSHGFNAKIGLKNEPLWAEIFTKMFFNMARQTKPPANNVFLKYLSPGWVIFQTDFCVETGHFSYNKRYKRNILSMNLKNHLKNPKFRENWLGKKACHSGVCDP